MIGAAALAIAGPPRFFDGGLVKRGKTYIVGGGSPYLHIPRDPFEAMTARAGKWRASPTTYVVFSTPGDSAETWVKAAVRAAISKNKSEWLL